LRLQRIDVDADIHLPDTALALTALPAFAGSGVTPGFVSRVDGRRNLHRRPFLIDRLPFGFFRPPGTLVMMSEKPACFFTAVRPASSDAFRLAVAADERVAWPLHYRLRREARR
jgi:hypothetical protein